MVVNPDPVMVPGVWGPYYGAMLPGWWLGEGGQSAAGALLDWTLRQSDAWPLLENTAKAEDRNLYAVLNDWAADLESRETWPTRDLHVLSDHHGNRSPRANPHARGVVVGLTLEQGKDALSHPSANRHSCMGGSTPICPASMASACSSTNLCWTASRPSLMTARCSYSPAST